MSGGRDKKNAGIAGGYACTVYFSNCPYCPDRYSGKCGDGTAVAPDPPGPFDFVADSSQHVVCGRKWERCEECLAGGHGCATRMLAPPDEICFRLLAFMRSLDDLAEEHPGKFVEFDWEKNEIVKIYECTPHGRCLSYKNRLVRLRDKPEGCRDAGQEKNGRDRE